MTEKLSFKGYDKLYQEYLDGWRSIILADMRQADKFVEYLKTIGHKLSCNLSIKWAKDIENKDVVHVCESLYVKKENNDVI